MEQQGILFIPDISGFTEFVTQTENRHSSHIISELLEIIINKNEINLNVSEIEGDAVLFYKFGNAEDFETIVNQMQNMFIAFHRFKKVIERDNICRCGACTSVSQLTLKFVVHYGLFNEVPIKNFKKIMGGDVILAHRLLKNKIKSTEYILFTENYLSTQKEVKTPIWAEICDHSEIIDKFGEIKSRYFNLTPLHEHVPDVELLSSERKSDIPFDFNIIINAPLLFVHGQLIDNKTKLDWVEGVKNIDEDNLINRVNGSHTCVFDDLEIHFITRDKSVSDNMLQFSEEAEAGLDFSLINDYKLEDTGENTKLSLRIIPGRIKTDINFIKKIVLNIKMKLIINRILQKSKKDLARFKTYCEEKYNSSN